MTYRSTWLVCLLALPALAQNIGLEGEWLSTEESSSEGYIFAADGRFAVFDRPDGSYQFGRWRTEGDILELHFPSGPSQYNFKRSDAQLELSYGDAFFEVTTSYARSPDSRGRVAAVLAAPVPADIPGLLLGRWDQVGEYLSGAYVFLSDGRYLHFDGDQPDSLGRYKLEAGKLVFCGLDGAPSYEEGMDVFGPILELRTEMFDGSQLASHYRKAAADPTALEAAWTTPAAEELAALLPGRWSTDPEAFLSQQFSFHPAGHCVLQDDISTNFGNWRLEGFKLFVDDLGGWTHEYTLSFFGEFSVFSMRTVNGDELAYFCTLDEGSLAEVERELAKPPAEALRDALLGCWKSEEEMLGLTWIFVDDRYYYSSETGDITLASRGKIELDGEQLTVWNRAEGAAVYEHCWILGGRQLVLVGSSSQGGLVPIVYGKTPASDEEIRAWAETVEAEKRAADEAWLQRIPVGPRKEQGAFGGAGDVPADPDAGFVYTDAVVFAEMELYFWQGLAYEVEFGPNAGSIVYDRTDWYFLPNGRVYKQVSSHGPAQPLIQGIWGRYKLEGQQIRWSVPGEEEVLDLEDGRRNLYSPDNLQFNNLKAAEAALSQD